jgi:hypothetical protein
MNPRGQHLSGYDEAVKRLQAVLYLAGALLIAVALLETRRRMRD